MSKWKLSKFFVAQEATFNLDPDATGAAYKFVKDTGGATFQPSVDIVERPGYTGSLTRQPHVIGPKGGKLQLKLELKASGTPAGGAPAIASESSPLLEASLGTVVRGTGSTIAAGTTTSALTVTSAAGFSKYMLISVNGETRFITAIAGSVLTLDRALVNGVPANGTTVYASSLFKRANTGHKSVSIVAYRDGVEYTFTGCYVKSKIAGISPKGTAIVEFDIEVGSWTATTKNASALPAALPLPAISAVKAPVVKGATLALSAAARTISALAFDPGQTFAFIETTSDVDNKGGMELTDSKPMGSFKPYYNSDQIPDLLAGTSKTLAFSAGDQTNGWGLYVPGMQYTDDKFENAGGLIAESINFAVNDNGVDPEYVICQF
jgi:hypothetical protein